MTAVEDTTDANVGDANTTTRDVITSEKSLPDVASTTNDEKIDNDDASSYKPSTENKDDKEPQQQQRGLFSRLFRRDQKKEPTLVNGAADLLDDERGETTTHDDSSAEASEDEADATLVSDNEDDEEEAYGDDEDFKGIENADEESEGEQDEWETDKSDQNGEESNPEDNDDDFGDFAQATNNDETDEDETEMMSLIAGGGSTTGNNSGKINSLGASFSKFLGIAPNEKVQKERQSLLDVGNETDEEDNNNYQDDEDDIDDGNYHKDGTQKRGFLQDKSAYYDSHSDDDYDDDDLRTETGEYRLESFYPADSCRHEFPDKDEPNRQNLYGRIHGFGSESAGLMDASTSSRMFMDTMSDRRMSSMDVEASDDRGGLLNGVGKAVSSITQLILQKRGSPDEEKRKMLSYIAELEHKLEQKERDLQSWKKRAKQLQLEVQWLNEKGEENDDESEGESTAEEEFEETARIEYQGVDTDEDCEVREGILIDTTPQAPVFDPLLQTMSNEKANDGTLDDDLLDASRYNVDPEVSRPRQEDQNELSGESDKSSASGVPKDTPGVHGKTQETSEETSNHLVRNESTESKGKETSAGADC